MARKHEPKLTSQQRLRRGLHYTAVGPVDVTRGVVGVTARMSGMSTRVRGVVVVLSMWSVHLMLRVIMGRHVHATVVYP